MEKLFMKAFIILILNVGVIPVFGQDHKPQGFAIEVSLENTDLPRLPIYRNAISSLEISGDYIIGGTSASDGLTPFVFVASLSERKLISIKDLDKVIPRQRSIQSGFCKGRNNLFYAGTIANKVNGSTEDGHLVQVSVGTKGAINIKDLGVPVHGEGIFSLLCNSAGTMLYGVSYPSGLFFTYNIKTGETRTFRDIAPTNKDLETYKQYIVSPSDYLCGALIEDNEGLIYGSMPINNLFYFNPKDASFHVLKDGLPQIWKRSVLGRVDSWAKAKDGKLYGGNAGDGQLFEIDPATKKVKNLGKPIMMNRIRGLGFGRDGNLYGVAGAPPGYAHLFSYDSENGYRDFGNPMFPMVATGIEQGIPWRAFNISTVTSAHNGEYIVMGEDESLSQLLIFIVPQN